MSNVQEQEMKRCLRSYRILRREESRLRVRLADLERRIRLPALHRGKADRKSMEALAARHRQDLLDLIEETLRRCREIEEIIGRTEGAGEDRTQLYRQILRLRYVDGLTFCEIADRLHYHERHIRRLHREALTAAIKGKGGEVHGEHME